MRKLNTSYFRPKFHITATLEMLSLENEEVAHGGDHQEDDIHHTDGATALRRSDIVLDTTTLFAGRTHVCLGKGLGKVGLRVLHLCNTHSNIIKYCCQLVHTDVWHCMHAAAAVSFLVFTQHFLCSHNISCVHTAFPVFTQHSLC